MSGGTHRAGRFGKTREPAVGARPVTRLAMRNWIGKYIYLLRVHNRMTQGHTGAIMGMSQGSVSKVEQGEQEPGFHEVLRFLAHVRVPVERVVGPDGKPQRGFTVDPLPGEAPDTAEQ